MKKNKKIIISIIISILIVALGIFIYYRFFYDANKLNLSEKEWLNSHKTSLITFNIPNELNVFSKSGKGVFYDFLNGLEKENELTLNKTVLPIGEENGLGFVVNKNIDKNDLLVFKDHYVLVSKEKINIHNLTDLNGKTIGALSLDISRITANYNTTISFTQSENKESLLDTFKNNKVAFIIVPLNEYIDEILSNNYQIIYHLDDITNNYYLNLGTDKTLNSIVQKYYNKWINNSYEDSFYENLHDLFVDKLSISQIDLDTLTSRNYNYGFVTSTPYQTLNSSRFGGKIMAYLEDFSKFSDVTFTYTKFKNNNELSKAYDKGKVDLLFEDASYNYKGSSINTNIINNYSIIGPIKNAFKVSNLMDLSNIEVYALKDSKVANKLKENNKINIKTVNTEKDLLKLIRKQKIVALNTDTYNYLKNNKIKNYTVIYQEYLPNYSFKYQNSNDTFSKIFSNYVNYLSDYNMNNNGLLSFRNAESSGNLISTFAKYILIVISVIVVILAIVFTSKKHIKINTKRIRKDEKLKYVDMLTSLKNRNYLNERINIWNENTIYPQAIIVIDLNNIKYLNDTFGAKEGDKQIMAAANILHQTQLDNTEIMRTDGNEFTIYLVGYNEKQVVNYLKKLVKEFNDLPYEYGAAFGFSMIVDDLKLIDDAINEATLQMRENKEIENEKSERENE